MRYRGFHQLDNFSVLECEQVDYVGGMSCTRRLVPHNEARMYSSPVSLNHPTRNFSLRGMSAWTQNPEQKAEIRFAGGITRCSASVVAILLASFPAVASAQGNCAAMALGPARTDCYLALSQFYRAKSDLAAAQARAQSDAAWYRAITGTDSPTRKPHRRR